MSQPAVSVPVSADEASAAALMTERRVRRAPIVDGSTVVGLIGLDEDFVTKAAFMHGIKGFTRYTIVERNKWMGSPLTRRGYSADVRQFSNSSGLT